LVSRSCRGAVAEFRRLRGRAGDIGEGERGEHPVRLGLAVNPREEACDLVGQCFLVAFPREVVVARQLDHASGRNAFGHKSRGDAKVFLRAAEHENWQADRRQDGASKKPRADHVDG
jgi:hypothetical protein